MTQNKRVIAIIGGIGSGKTQVCNYLKGKGYYVISADDISRGVADCDEVLTQIASVFGNQYVVDGQLNRKALRQYVFADMSRVEQLNNIFLNRIARVLKERIEHSETDVVFVEITNYTGLLDDMFSAKWLVECSENNRIKRVVFRDNVTIKHTKQLIKAQTIPSAVDEIIDNNGTVEQLHSVINQLLNTNKL
ncbi:MAG: dephospho-CoA kinase [Clostridia bacterium]|nr:dephospho-CoA kinase [Clostridia bacterium]